MSTDLQLLVVFLSFMTVAIIAILRILSNGGLGYKSPAAYSRWPYQPDADNRDSDLSAILDNLVESYNSYKLLRSQLQKQIALQGGEANASPGLCLQLEDIDNKLRLLEQAIDALRGLM